MMFEDKGNTKKLLRFIPIVISLNEIIIDFLTFFQKKNACFEKIGINAVWCFQRIL